MAKGTFLTRIFVAGHRGLVGSAITRAIDNRSELEWFGRSRSELDLLNREDVFRFVGDQKPDAIIIAAAKVGGIRANSTFPVEFLSENLQIETNLIDAAQAANIEKVLFLGSSCIYPKLASQPIKEEYLLTGELEPTNEAYALAKIAGLKLVQSYRREYNRGWISLMPTNMYGPGDNFDLENAHVMPALLHRFHLAKVQGAEQVVVWGSGSPRREFLHSDDLASACLFALENYDGEVALNVGTGEDISIRDLAELIKKTVGFEGEIVWDSSKPDGTPRKLLDVTRMSELGWKASKTLEQGIQETYDWFKRNY